MAAGGSVSALPMLRLSRAYTHFSLSLSLSAKDAAAPPRMERNVSLCASAVVVQTEKTMEEGERSQPAEKNANEVFFSTTFLMVRFWDYVGGGPLNLIHESTNAAGALKPKRPLGVYT